MELHWISVQEGLAIEIVDDYNFSNAILSRRTTYVLDSQSNPVVRHLLTGIGETLRLGSSTKGLFLFERDFKPCARVPWQYYCKD